ncbi:MAG: 4Fe-4S dicluster domain-containing protein [Deltaproteobacteria bacterium]|nr:4Fe-4S dicluster domain-containing protein [Deltaproteobacteria bacterium]
MVELKPTPERPPCFDPNDARFWDPDDLEAELRRVFEICHGCRMCVGYCPSFPFLFERIDENHEQRAMAHSAVTLDAGDLRTVTDLCFQCKLCYVKCPYTPEDPGSTWLVDFPRLLWREKTVRTRREGLSLQERVLGEPGLLGALNAGPQAGLVNFVSAQALVRKAMDKVAGIAPEFPLPTYASQPFSRWFKRRPKGEGNAGGVALFSTCLVEYNRPRTGRAAVAVLEHAGLSVTLPEQGCCGMPTMDTGDWDSLREKARYNVERLVEEVRAGRDIVCPGPSCSMTLKKEYPELLGSPEAALVASHTFDLMEYLAKLDRAGTLPRNFVKSLGKIAYHAPCHLRAQRIATPTRGLLEQVPDTEVTVVEQCSAVDGTWGMKSQYYDLGVRYSRKLVRGIRDAEAAHVASDCPLASQRIAKENGVAVSHPVELLALAYGLDPDKGG